MITALTRNLYVSGGETHAPSPVDPGRPKCGTSSKGAPFRPTLQRVSCHKCGVGRYRLDEFESWDTPHVASVIEDSGDSITIRTIAQDVPGIDLALDMRIKPEDLDRFIARLTEIKEARGL